MDSKTKKFLKIERVSAIILMSCLGSAILAVTAAIILKNLGLENSAAYYAAGVLAVTGAILSFPVGFWIAGRPRYCPKCNTEMEQAGERSTLVYKCPACGFEFDTHMDNMTGG